MGFTVREAAQIFEDPIPPPSPTKTPKQHRRIPSVGDVLRGRRRDDSPVKSERTKTTTRSQSPLGERHINSPPQQKRVPLKDDQSRPTMHKKTGSSVSLKELIMGKERPSDTSSMSSRDEVPKKSPKKTKSSTNLAGLLKKRSRKDLKDESKNQENIPPPSSSMYAPRTPIWAEYATQPVQGVNGTLHYPQAVLGANETQQLLKHNDSYHLPPQCQESHIASPACLDYVPPQRPFLEHRSSRSSIFTENLDEENEAVAPPIESPELPQSLEDKSPSERPHMQKQISSSSVSPEKNGKRASRVLEALSTFGQKNRLEKVDQTSSHDISKEPLSPQQLDSELEKVLDSLNIPPNLRDNMRNLKADVKLTLIRGERVGSGSSAGPAKELSEARSSMRSLQKKDSRPTSSDKGDQKEERRPRSRSRPRSRVFAKRDETTTDKQEKPDSSARSRSKSRPLSREIPAQQPVYSRSMPSTTSLASFGPADSAIAPDDFIHYLKEVQKPSLVEVGKLHKLRILLRNESINWTDTFVTQGGMDELASLLYRILAIEWRDEHDDNVLHEVLLCLKALCTTTLALMRLEAVEQKFFTTLLAMLFDEERKGPSEFNTRGVVITLLFAHLSAALQDGESRRQQRARRILDLLRDPVPEEGKKPLEFVSQMHVSRPYRIWCKEVVNVTKEVFWIFLHHMNVVPINEVDQSLGYCQAHYPPPRPPHPAAPYVGGVEWDATQYLATHLDLLNGILASLPTKDERNALRGDLQHSGWEKVMGVTLRTCKEKFYGGVHDGLKVWVAAAKVDGWIVEDVRAGPPRETTSPQKSPNKKREPAPQISLDVEVGNLSKIDDGWV